MVKRSIEQDLRNKNFGIRNGNYERNAVVKNPGKNSVDKEFLEIVGNGKPTGSVLKETIAVSVTISINVQNRHLYAAEREKSVENPKSQRKESQW